MKILFAQTLKIIQWSKYPFIKKHFSDFSYVNSLTMAQKLVEAENIEFYVLVDRLQDINQRLEKDTTFLLDRQQKIEGDIEDENFGVKDLRDRELKKRRKAKVEKESWQGQKADALETYDG